jgi:hypothetical protein
MGASNYDDVVVARKAYGYLTQTAATKISRLIEPRPDGFARLCSLIYLVGANDHQLTLMRPFNRVSFTADAAAGQAVVNISADPGNYSAINPNCRTANNLIAANDFVVYRCADGTFVMDTVASVATLAITLTANVPTGGVKSGDPLWWFGIATDTNPHDAAANPTLLASATTTFTPSVDACRALGTIPDLAGGPTFGNGMNCPLILQSNNVTAAGFFVNVGVEYVHKSPLTKKR